MKVYVCFECAYVPENFSELIVLSGLDVERIPRRIFANEADAKSWQSQKTAKGQWREYEEYEVE